MAICVSEWAFVLRRRFSFPLSSYIAYGKRSSSRPAFAGCPIANWLACRSLSAAYDENSSSGALWTCDSSKAVDYTVTFCPSSGGSSAQGGNSAQAASAAPVAVASGTSSPPVLVAEPSPAPAEGAVGGCAASPAVSSPAVARRMEPRHKSSDRFTHHQ